eukprot:18792-Heterococcus_DN1.PRE.5
MASRASSMSDNDNSRSGTSSAAGSGASSPAQSPTARSSYSHLHSHSHSNLQQQQQQQSTAAGLPWWGAAFMGSTTNTPDLQGLTDSKEARGQYLAHFSKMCCTETAETATKVHTTSTAAALSCVRQRAANAYQRVRVQRCLQQLGCHSAS